MREPALQDAIAAAGGVSELARRIGIAPPSVSTWQRVPAERVVAVEAVTGISRDRLRPDLYAASEVRAADADPIDRARAEAWRLVARLMLGPPDATLLARLGQASGGAGRFGAALAALAEAARGARPEAVEREYFALFIGLGRGEVLPYGSWYLAGFLNDKPLARLRAEMRRLGIASEPGIAEPEDHVGRVAEMLAGLIEGPFAQPLEVQAAFFQGHIAPWAGRLFEDVTKAQQARFYRAVAELGGTLVALETEAFALPS